MSSDKVTLEDVILNLPANQRQAVADVREQKMHLERKVSELEAELVFLKQRNTELESSIQHLQTPQVSVPAPVMSLQDLVTALKQQSAQQIEDIRHRTTESLSTIDDPSFDPFMALQQSVSRNLKPLPRNFEFVDLVALKENLLQEGHTPKSPVQIPLLREFASHVDGVRQCTKDGRFVHIFYDPIKADVLRRLFDMCKTVESKLGTTTHLTLPNQTVVFDPTELKNEDISTVRQKEMQLHATLVSQCGNVFERATGDVLQLDELFLSAQTLPHMLSDFEQLIQSMQTEMENVQSNEVLLKEGGNLQIDNIKEHRLVLQEQSETTVQQIAAKQREIDKIFEEMFALLQRSEEQFQQVSKLVTDNCRIITEIALCDHRMTQIRKTVEQEAQKQQKFYEGAKFTTFLANKARDMFRRVYNNLEESMRSRRELCERTRVSSQEQLYTMAENLHDIIAKRMSADNQSAKRDQASLDSANRALMTLVHNPAEMEKNMEHIRNLTLEIAATKNRVSQNSVDLQEIRNLVTEHKTIQFLKRDTNFLTIYDSVEKSMRTKERVDEIIQKIKFVSEVLVEVSDPDTRQDFMVEQCLEAVKQTVGDVGDLISSRMQIENLEEQFRIPSSTKLKRHRRLIAHFLEEIREGSNDLRSKEPNIEIHTVALLDGMDVVIAAMTHNDEPIPQNLRSAYNLAAAGGMQQVHADANIGSNIGETALRGKEPSASPAPSVGRGTFGGGRGGSAAADHLPIFQETEQPVHTFARFSERLRISGDGAKLTKVPAGMEISNTSALGGIGFRLASGVHYFTIRIGPNCGRLLIGFADWNLPLDGYCNSLKYQGCYYLHVGNGTLWAPEHGIERQQYTYEAIGTEVGTQLKCVVDTNERTISFVVNDHNLGVAFRNVNLSRTLYPAFEVFSNNSTVEFVNLVSEKTLAQR